jgi:hypothetical protein
MYCTVTLASYVPSMGVDCPGNEYMYKDRKNGKWGGGGLVHCRQAGRRVDRFYGRCL